LAALPLVLFYLKPPLPACGKLTLANSASYKSSSVTSKSLSLISEQMNCRTNRVWRWFVWSGLVCALACDSAAAQYRFDAWTTNNGLPQNSVNAILQTRDGYLWCTTLDGLVRYSGAQFTVFNSANTRELVSQRFNSLYEDHDGNLWIKSEDGALLRYRAGRFTAFTTEQGLPDKHDLRLGRTVDGGLLVSTPAGLARFQNERFVAVAADPLGFNSMLGYRGLAAIAGATDTVWYRRGTELRRVRNGRLTVYQVPEGEPHHLYEDRQGRLWIGAAQQAGVVMLKDETLRYYTVKDGLPPAPVTSFCEDHTGALWFGTNGGGLVRFKDEQFTTFTTKQGLSSNKIRTIFEDREGALWVGTGDSGLMRLTPQIITTYAEKDGMVGKVLYPILEDHAGDIWIGNEGINRFKDGRFTYYSFDFRPRPPTRQDPFSAIRSLYEDQQGRLLLGGGDAGVIAFQNGKFSPAAVTLPATPLAIHQDRQGAFWFGFNGKLLREQAGVRQWFDAKDGLQGITQPIFEDRQGRLWIGSYGGLAQYVDGRLRFYTERDGLSSKRIRALYEDGEGVLWIGTYDGGLNRFKDGRFTRYTTQEGMFSNGVFSILEDGRGNFWMGSNQGIHRVRRQQLNNFADGRVTRIDAVGYGTADGMLSAECNGGRHPSALRARDGRLWFPTLNGVAVVDPAAVTFNATPPPVVIESVTLDRAALDSRQPVAIYPGQAQLEVAYAGLSFIKPEHIRFKYRLEGLDRDWVETDNRRVAYFSHLPAGSYTFHVIAANSDGVWNETGARLAVTVYPPFWRTPWFTALVVLSGLTLATLLYRARIRKLERAQAAQETFARQLLASQEGERKRIAAELHDSLGQNLLVIKNFALIALSTADAANPTREHLNEISDAATQSLEDVRHIAHNLRPYQIERLGLTATLQFMLRQIAYASEIIFTNEIDPLDGLLTKDGELSLYRIVQETLNNILKHSEARQASVQIKRHGDEIRITIADNGRGFSPVASGWRLAESNGQNVFQPPTPHSPLRASQTSGFGLTGTAERVRMLSGKLTIQSAPGEGTTLVIVINAKSHAVEH
jgi:ligand-binding sensor domain-containing protein/signal transduction histidine kinase